jgi:hypothetical protein
MFKQAMTTSLQHLPICYVYNILHLQNKEQVVALFHLSVPCSTYPQALCDLLLCVC